MHEAGKHDDVTVFVSKPLSETPYMRRQIVKDAIEMARFIRHATVLDHVPDEAIGVVLVSACHGPSFE